MVWPCGWNSTAGSWSNIPLRLIPLPFCHFATATWTRRPLFPGAALCCIQGGYKNFSWFKIVNTVHLPGGVPLIHKSPVGGMCLMSCILWFLRLVGCHGNSSSKFVEMWLEMHSWSMLFDSLTIAKRFYFIHSWCEIWLNCYIVLCAYNIQSCVWGIQWRRGVLGLTGQATRAAEDQISDISIFSNFTKFFIAWFLTLKLTGVHRQRWASTCFPRALMILPCWVHACLLLLFVVFLLMNYTHRR